LVITFRLWSRSRWRYTPIFLRLGRLIRYRCFFLLGNVVVWLLLAWNIWLRRSSRQLGRLSKATRWIELTYIFCLLKCYAMAC